MIEELQLIMQAPLVYDILSEAQEEPDEQEEANTYVDQQLYCCSGASLPLQMFYRSTHNDSVELRCTALRNFLQTSFDQRVGGNAITLISEATKNVVSTIHDLGIENSSVIFPFKRNILHYAAYYKWNCVFKYVMENQLVSLLFKADLFGLNAIDYYFINLEANYCQYVEATYDRDLKRDIPSYTGEIHEITANSVNPAYKIEYFLFENATHENLVERIYGWLSILYYQKDEQEDYEINKLVYKRLNGLEFVRRLFRSFELIDMGESAVSQPDYKDYQRRESTQQQPGNTLYSIRHWRIDM